MKESVKKLEALMEIGGIKTSVSWSFPVLH